MTTASVKSMDPIEWLPWSGETFTRAQDEQRPVLLTVGAAWCRWTAEMLRSTYTDADRAPTGRASVHSRLG